MHPILYIELKQVVRDYKPILFFIGVMTTLRIALGDYGHIINLFIIFPSIAGALGTGLLAEEYSKNYMKYLYTLPIKRWHFIAVKMIITAIAIAVFILIIYLIKWSIPPRLMIPVHLFPKIFNLKSLILATSAISLFNYAVCMFSVTFLKSPKLAGSLNYVSIVIAGLYLLYYFLDSGYKYQVTDYLMIFCPTSAILIAGGFLLFMLRNPFLNRNPRHFVTGLVVAGIGIGYFIVSTQWIIAQEERNVFSTNRDIKTFESFRGVTDFSVSPDGKFVYIQTSPDDIIGHGYILDASENLYADLGKHASSFKYEFDWQFNHGKRMFVYKKEKPVLSEISARQFVECFALDLDQKKQYPFKSLELGNSYAVDYRQLNCDKLELDGFCYLDPSDTDSGICYFTQNLRTGKVTRTFIPDSQGISPSSVKYTDDDHIIFEQKIEPTRLDESKPLILTIFDKKQQQTAEVELPKGVSSGEYKFKNGVCYYIEESSDDYGFSYRFVSRTLEGTQTVYLTSEELPKISYREAMVDMGNSRPVSFSVSPDSKWLACFFHDVRGQYHLMLLDENGNRIDLDINKETSQKLWFSPDQKHFCLFLSDTDNRDAQEQMMYFYQISGQKVELSHSGKLETKIWNMSFLDNNTILYLKNPKPHNEFENNTCLIKAKINELNITKTLP